jgi:short-subunit dehydrogenase
MRSAYYRVCILRPVELGRDTRVLVTGASRGIGRCLARELAARGCTVGLVARNADELETLAEELRSVAPGGPARGGARAVPLPADVAERKQVEAAVARFVEQEGGLEVVIANAGVAYYAPFAIAPIEEAERMTQINWLGTLYTVGAALPILLDGARGQIAIVSSAAGHRAFPWAAAYGATKFAQRGFLEALRHELSGTGVGVTGIYPGAVESHLHDDDRAHMRMPDWHRPGVAIRPERVARAVVDGIERERRAVFVPPVARILGIVHGVSPALADRLLRLIMGGTAAPAR